MWGVRMRIVNAKDCSYSTSAKRKTQIQSGRPYDDNPDHFTRCTVAGSPVRRSGCDIANIDSCLCQAFGGRTGTPDAKQNGLSRILRTDEGYPSPGLARNRPTAVHAGAKLPR